jgi:hypothetical protein
VTSDSLRRSRGPSHQLPRNPINERLAPRPRPGADKVRALRGLPPTRARSAPEKPRTDRGRPAIARSRNGPRSHSVLRASALASSPDLIAWFRRGDPLGSAAGKRPARWRPSTARRAIGAPLESRFILPRTPRFRRRRFENSKPTRGPALRREASREAVGARLGRGDCSSYGSPGHPGWGHCQGRGRHLPRPAWSRGPDGGRPDSVRIDRAGSGGVVASGRVADLVDDTGLEPVTSGM